MRTSPSAASVRPFRVLVRLALCVALISCAGQRSLALSAAGMHSLTIRNGTGEFALVRIKTASGQTRGELAIEAGGSGSLSLDSGQYFEVVRFGRSPDSFRYAKGEGFTLSAPSGGYVQATLTLHGVVDGNYVTQAASRRDFE